MFDKKKDKEYKRKNKISIADRIRDIKGVESFAAEGIERMWKKHSRFAFFKRKKEYISVKTAKLMHYIKPRNAVPAIRNHINKKIKNYHIRNSMSVNEAKDRIVFYLDNNKLKYAEEVYNAFAPKINKENMANIYSVLFKKAGEIPVPAIFEKISPKDVKSSKEKLNHIIKQTFEFAEINKEIPHYDRN